MGNVGNMVLYDPTPSVFILGDPLRNMFPMFPTFPGVSTLRERRSERNLVGKARRVT
jgi:hypothetical protein